MSWRGKTLSQGEERKGNLLYTREIEERNKANTEERRSTRERERGWGLVGYLLEERKKHYIHHLANDWRLSRHNEATEEVEGAVGQALRP